MKISSATLIHTWNAIGNIFKSLVDEDRSATIAARRMKLSSIKTYEDKCVQKVLKLADGDRIDAPYNIIVPSNKENENNSYIHLYLVESEEVKDVRFMTTNDFFFDQYSICMIFMNKDLFTLNSNDIENVVDCYYELFGHIIDFMDNQPHREYDRSLITTFITYSFLKIILPESYQNKMLDEVSMMFTGGLYRYSKDGNTDYLNKIIEYSNKFTELNTNLIIASTNVASAQMIMFDYLNDMNLNYRSK